MPNIRPQQWKFTLGYLAWVILTIWFLHSIFTPAQPRELSYSDFLNEVKGRPSG